MSDKNLSELLGVDDPEKQAEVVSKLIKLASGPVVVMTATIDTRSGAVNVMLNDQYSVDQVYTFLDVIRRDITQREREMLLANESEAGN